MQIVLDGNTVLATHADEQDLTGKYPGLRILTVSGYYEAGQTLEDATFPTETAAANNVTTMRQQAEQALVDLSFYRDRANPTSAQTTAAVKTLCRVAIALIRLQLKRHDGAD